MSGQRDVMRGNRGLDLDEPLIFEQGQSSRCGVDLPDPPEVKERLGPCKRLHPVDLPGLAEPQVVRHFVRISRNNYSIDANMYPLGSCTMKHNPRLNEKLARLAGFADLHPLQPHQTVQGILQLMDTLATWIKELTGMPSVAMSPGAGAHGELCGIMAVRSALEARGDPRKRVLVPDSAHGTNPATAALCNYEVDSVPSNKSGRIDLAAFKGKLDTDVAAIMLTNPNTCGLFETDILEIAEAVHAAGGFFYCDGANFNALVGRVRPGDLGIDTMHINLHKTFSTPHGGGGPGAGPVVFSEALAPYAPVPWVVHGADGFELEEVGDGKAFGRMKGFHGQVGMFIRAMAYMKSHGADGLRQVADDAVLAANYVMARLEDLLPPPYPGPCMHEVLFDDSALKDSGVTTLDLAKAMIDEGYHPMTVYFPLIVPGAMLTEPTETESKESLDQFIEMMRTLIKRAKAGDEEFFQKAPQLTPASRLDETNAARHPVLRWHPPVPRQIAG